ncbi:Homoserine dehydrogenase [Phycisphaerae bacterium RAS1]|nr:Homoserine dehydrogenase [Phycisphaerae bacterium RAS1]
MRVLLTGFGVVGQALVRLLEERAAELYRAHGLTPRVVGVIDSRGAALSESGLTAEALLNAKRELGTIAAVDGHGLRGARAAEFVGESDADVVVVATPTRLNDPAGDIAVLKAAFRSGKHAISVNKAPLAVAMPALLELARYNRRILRYSGTVGAGTPVIALAREAARGDTIVRLRAILNGTTNYILWKMTTEGWAFEKALGEAQRLGYAETDPSTDIDGIDTATKIVILANAVLGVPARLADVAISGIRGLPLERIREATARGNVVKLVGEIGDATALGESQNGGAGAASGGPASGRSSRVVSLGEETGRRPVPQVLSVSPQEVRAGGSLDVPANLNAVCVSLKNGGDVTLIGRGAGGTETATAIVRDLIDIWHEMGGREES